MFVPVHNLGTVKNFMKKDNFNEKCSKIEKRRKSVLCRNGFFVDQFPQRTLFLLVAIADRRSSPLFCS